ncbi:MAG: hypothetical protein JXB44_07665, partial [Calditrichaceae bacterium]
MIVVLIYGLNDLATACALRLYRSGFQPVLCAPSKKNDIHSLRNFSAVLTGGKKVIEEVEAMTIAYAQQFYELSDQSSDEKICKHVLEDRKICVINETEIKEINAIIRYFITADDVTDSISHVLSEFNGKFIMFSSDKSELHASYTISDDQDTLGKVLYPFLSIEEKNVRKNNDSENIYCVNAPIEGLFTADKLVNDIIIEKEIFGKINDIPILSPVSGKITGILRSGVLLEKKEAIIEIDQSKKNDGRIIPFRYF